MNVKHTVYVLQGSSALEQSVEQMKHVFETNFFRTKLAKKAHISILTTVFCMPIELMNTKATCFSFRKSVSLTVVLNQTHVVRAQWNRLKMRRSY